jgi:CRISPR-associated protein Cas1
MNVHWNTLYVTTDGAYLHKDHDTVVVRVEQQTKAQLPLLHLGSVVCFGRVSVSPELMAALTEAGIHVAFFGRTGRFLARVEGMPGGNVLLRRQQYRVADDDARSLSIARAMVIGKVSNTRQFVAHARRDAAVPDKRDALGQLTERLSMHLRSLLSATTLETVRGLEGIAAKEYFGAFDALVKRNEEAFALNGRTRRPPRDRMNALLSFGYALLMQDCAGAAAGVGLDPAVGYLHEERPGRLCLALDLMEELRAPVVDRLMVSMVNRGQLGPEDFDEEETGGVRLKDGARKAVLVAYQEAKAVEVRHEMLDQDTVWGRVPHLQAQFLARTLRGDLDVYAPFSIR